MQKATNTPKAIIWAIRVKLMFIRMPLSGTSECHRVVRDACLVRCRL
jgi:hypothetical protein